jgi:hypothetical protein
MLFKEVVVSAGIFDPTQYGPTAAKFGRTCGVISMVIVVGVAHSLAFGVKV